MTLRVFELIQHDWSDDPTGQRYSSILRVLCVLKYLRFHDYVPLVVNDVLFIRMPPDVLSVSFRLWILLRINRRAICQGTVVWDEYSEFSELCGTVCLVVCV